MGLAKQNELTTNHIKTESAASKTLLVSGICNSSTTVELLDTVWKPMI